MTVLTRRQMCGAIATGPLVAVTSCDASSPQSGRPDLEVERIGPSSWRHRSWTFRSGAWRPRWGLLAVNRGAVTITHPPEHADDRMMLETFARGVPIA